MGDEIDPKLKLYLRLPVRIVDEIQIKDLHPAITRVWIPRQKAKWCVVAFGDSSSLKTGREAIKNTKINDKKIIVKTHRKGEAISAKSTKKSSAQNVSADSLLHLLPKKEKEESSM